MSAGPSIDPVPPPGCIAVSVGNLRDLGGARTGTGGVVATGRLFRSSHFAALADADAQAVARLCLRTVVDLRGQAERTLAPGRLAGPGLADIHLPIEPSAMGAMRDKREAGQLDEAAMVEIMTGVYRRFVHRHAAVYARLFELLQDEARYPLVFHCTAGKDRTGFGAALVLLALGVPRDAVMSDFLQSNGRWQPSQPSSDWAVLGRVRPEYLEVALAEMARGWGSVDGYLAGPMRLDDAARERLVQRLVVARR